MKKFKDISEQYREEGRHKLIQPKNKAVVSPRPENDSAKVKLGEEMQTPSIAVRSLYTKMYAKHGGTVSQAKDAQSKAYAEVEKKHGKEMRNSLEAYHKKNMNEEILDEGRPSQRHPLEGHEYHKKTNAELEYIAKDAHKAAEAMKSHNTQAENKYRDQANDSATVRYFRQKNGMPDWYKKKYGHMNEAVKDKYDIGEYDQEGDMAKSDLRSIIANSKRVHDMLKDDDNLPEWVQSKITKAEDYMSTVANYMEAEMNEEVEHHIIKSTHEKDDETGKPLYWNNNDGWGHKKYATKFSSKEKQSYRHIPMNSQWEKHVKEEVELDEENKPTNPELWSRAVAMAKSKFDVYPSAYANGWAAKWYKSKGGGWKSVNEENYEVTVMHTTKDGEKGEHTHKIMNADDARHAKNIALQKHDKMLKSKGVEIRGMGTTTSKVMEQKDNTPFKADKPEKQIATPGKYGAGYSAARHLARMAMQKQIEKQKKPVKEEKDDLPFKADKPKKQSVIPGKYGAGYSMARQLARQAMQKQIEKMKKKPVKEETNKAKIVKDVLKKKSSEDAFQKDPELSSTLTKGF